MDEPKNHKQRGTKPSGRITAAQFAARGALAIAVAAAAYFSITRTAAQMIVKSNPALAYRLAPGDGRMTAALAASLAAPRAADAVRSQADHLARLSLSQDPTAIVAVSTLGLNAQIRDHRPTARKFFTYAETLSRRDLQTQLWAIEDRVAMGDVAGAVLHYDIAMRTKVASWDLLFPVLASAAADPAVQTALLKALAAKPYWADAFLRYTASYGPDPRTTAALLIGARRKGIPLPEDTDHAVISELLRSHHIEEAWQYYGSLRLNADRRRSRDADFTAAIRTPTDFDWTPINEGGGTTSIQARGQGGSFSFAAPPSTGGPLLQQVQVLPAGRYHLEGRTTGIDQPADALPYWLLACREGGRELGRVVVPSSAQGEGRFSGNFVVPADCPVQTLVLMARPSDTIVGLSGELHRAQLTPEN